MISDVVVEYRSPNKYLLAWKGNQSVDIYLLSKPSAQIRDSVFLAKSTVGRAEFKVTKYYRPYFLLKDKDNQVVFSNRVLPLEGSNNFRDLGGYIGADGKHIKWGMLFRSDHLHRLTVRDEKVLDEIGIKTVIDYRSQDEYQVQPNQSWKTLKHTFHLIPAAQRAIIAAKAGSTEEKVRQLVQREVDKDINLDNSGQTMISQGKDFARLDENKKIYRKMIDLLLDENNTPIDQHCRGGKDRTGYGIAIILYLLGVDMETIIEDYMLTKTLRAKRNERRMAQYANETDDKNVLDYLFSMLDTRSEYLESSFSEMINISGSIDAYFKNELRITKEEIARLRNIYLE
jgi:protein-tyrosine phosphatase